MINARTTALLTALSTTAFSLPNSAQIITHWYAGVGALKSGYDVPNQSLTTPLNSGGSQTLNTLANDSDSGWKLFGGYQFHQHFTVEAGLINLGKFVRRGTRNLTDLQIVSDTDQVSIDVDSDIKTTLNPQGFSITGIALLPLFKGFSVNARAGLVLTNYESKTTLVSRVPSFTIDDTTFDARVISDSFSETANDVEYSAGLGFDYRPLPDWSIGFQWERYFKVGSDDIGVEEDIDTVNVNVTFHY